MKPSLGILAHQRQVVHFKRYGKDRRQICVQRRQNVGQQRLFQTTRQGDVELKIYLAGTMFIEVE